jgi:hypothetical protein
MGLCELGVPASRPDGDRTDVDGIMYAFSCHCRRLYSIGDDAVDDASAVLAEPLINIANCEFCVDVGV